MIFSLAIFICFQNRKNHMTLKRDMLAIKNNHYNPIKYILKLKTNLNLLQNNHTIIIQSINITTTSIPSQTNYDLQPVDGSPKTRPDEKFKKPQI